MIGWQGRAKWLLLPLTNHNHQSLAKRAEGVGFEPTVGCPTLDFESSALNRTQPPFPVRVIVDLSWPRAIIRQRAEFAKVKHDASFAYELENRGVIV